MSQYNRTHGQTKTSQAPLFASCWVALFLLLRDTFSRNSDSHSPALAGAGSKGAPGAN